MPSTLAKQRIESLLKTLAECGGDTPEHRRDQLLALLHARIAEEQAESAERFEKQMAELVSIAAEQKRLALELDRMTKKLINLTAWLKWLTVALVFLTCVLCLFELRRREHVMQVGLNQTQVASHIGQTIGNAQKATNH